MATIVTVTHATNSAIDVCLVPDQYWKNCPLSHSNPCQAQHPSGNRCHRKPVLWALFVKLSRLATV